MIENLYTQRSYAKCISEGYKFLAEHLWLVTKVMYPYFLVVSMIAVLSNMVNMHGNVSMLAGRDVYLEEIAAAIVLILLLITAYIFTLRRMFIMFKRLLGITSEKRESSPSYIKKVCKSIFHHFWKFLGTTLLSLFLLVVLSSIAYLPYVVATYTYFSSVEGQVNFNDAALIPVSGYVLIFCLCTLSYFVINMFSVAFYATMTFLYGSIKASK